MDQRVEPLSDTENENIEKQRNWVRDHYTPETAAKYDNLDGKLHVIQTILKENWIKSDETWKLQSLGVAFGDALAQKMGLSWVIVEDEIDRTPALQDFGTSIILYPLTMIQKRVLNEEGFDVRFVFDQLCDTIEEIRTRKAH